MDIRIDPEMQRHQPMSDSYKRRRGQLFEENEELMCMICLELANAATQVTCCGARNCRACISRCQYCPNCRQPVSPINIVCDVRCERLSAAALRPCIHDANGCRFEGNRVEVAAHEESCKFEPSSAVLQRFQTTAVRYKAVVQDMVLFTKRIEELSTHSLKLSAKYMKAAFGAQPIQEAMRLFHDIGAERRVYQVSRAESRDRAHTVSSGCAFWNNLSTLSFVIHESNYNVAAWFVKDEPGKIFVDESYPEVILYSKFLHPFDPKLSTSVEVNVSNFNFKTSEGAPNLMTSRELDEFCVNGNFYIAL
jgi:hypothetical protein